MAWIGAAIAAVGAIASNKNKAGGTSAGGGGSASAPFSDARSTQPSSMFDNSGWNVSFGDNSPITAPTSNNKTQSPSLSPSAGDSSMGVLPSAMSGISGNWTTYAIVFLVALVVIKKMKKKG